MFKQKNKALNKNIKPENNYLDWKSVCLVVSCIPCETSDLNACLGV